MTKSLSTARPIRITSACDSTCLPWVSPLVISSLIIRKKRAPIYLRRGARSQAERDVRERRVRVVGVAGFFVGLGDLLHRVRRRRVALGRHAEDRLREREPRARIADLVEALYELAAQSLVALAEDRDHPRALHGRHVRGS